MDPEALTRLGEFVELTPFPPDPYQTEAMGIVADGDSVVVAAPTGAGKTLVAEAAIHLARAAGRRAFYTTPLKALSNQKFGDFRDLYGADQVGLLTGDNSINGGASVVVMTTEVLRNMIYTDQTPLRDLGVVVLDEVHYLQDPFRGMVWEEIIIHLPAEIQIVALSATVSNAQEFTEWVATRRGPTRLVIEEHRPVPLESTYLVKDRNQREPLVLGPIFARNGRANEQFRRLFRPGRRHRGRFRVPRRFEVAELLDDLDLLPAIYFIFSRKGCDAAVEQTTGAGLSFTTDAEAATIAAYAAERTAHIDHGDLNVLGYGRWLQALQAGVASHHAGMVPAFKETVEELFRRGLVRVVFATETLSLGINMPARTVVLESLSKFTGEHHELLRPGDYTQLTGRAGRRGADTQGTAVVLYSPYVDFERVAEIASAGSHPLRSSFRPNYNMAANLIANYDRNRAEELLAASFGQFHRARETAELSARVASLQGELADARGEAACSRGDLWEFLADGDGQAPVRSRGSVLRAFTQELAAGDVLAAADPKSTERNVLLARGYGSNPRILLLSESGRMRRLKPDELADTSQRVGALPLPEPFQPRSVGYQHRVAAALRAWEPAGDAVLHAQAPEVSTEPPHPVAGCPHLGDHRRAARTVRRLERNLERGQRRLGRTEDGLTAQFRRTLELLGNWGYVDGWSLTERGARLRRIHNELDLLVVESVVTGAFSDLTSAELAALASVFVFDPRGGLVPGAWPNTKLADRWMAIDALSRRLAGTEASHRLPETRPPEPGFAQHVYAWASGLDLDDLLDVEDVAAGDFVRTHRQLIDLLVQLKDAFPELRERAGDAIDLIDRGVVAAGGLE